MKESWKSHGLSLVSFWNSSRTAKNKLFFSGCPSLYYLFIEQKMFSANLGDQ